MTQRRNSGVEMPPSSLLSAIELTTIAFQKSGPRFTM